MFNGSEQDNKVVGFLLKVVTFSGGAANRNNYTKIKVFSAH